MADSRNFFHNMFAKIGPCEYILELPSSHTHARTHARTHAHTHTHTHTHTHSLISIHTYLLYHFLSLDFMRSVKDGAATTINCAVNPELNSGQCVYYSDCAPKQPTAIAR